ncbi:MAG: DUF1883 domain-containing protein, partial [Salibacteraceae bacterium]
MKFLHGKKKVNRGGSITVDFSKPTRVLIMNNREFRKYKDNISFTYYGGFKEDSPYDLTIPKTDVWHVVVEKGASGNEIDLTASFKATQPVPAAPRKFAHTMAEADEALDGESTSEEEDSSEQEE